MSLQDLCRKYNISFKKQLGQNLLLDDNINRIMVEAAALSATDDVIEVGAGLGALTKHIAGRAGRVLAIEIDKSFMPCLEDEFRDNKNVVLFRGDILNHRVDKLLGEFIPGGAVYKMISNVPYYITTPILFHFWESSIPMSRMVFMVQEEVAKRLCARVNTDDFGVLSLTAALFGQVDIVHRVPASCFVPRPKVDSCIVRLRTHETPLYASSESSIARSLIRAAFKQRRKTLRNSLTRTGDFGAPREVVLEALGAAQIDPDRRPQTLTLEEFVQLAREIRARS